MKLAIGLAFCCPFLSLLSHTQALTLPPTPACVFPFSGVRVIEAAELTPVQVERVSLNPFHTSYGVYKMILDGRTVVVKIDTENAETLLPVFLLEAELGKVTGSQMIGMMDKARVTQLLRRNRPMIRKFEKGDKELGVLRRYGAATVMPWESGIKHFKTEVRDIVDTFPRQPAEPIIQQVAKLFAELERLEIIPRDMNIFLTPEGRVVILDTMTTAVYFVDGQAMSAGKPFVSDEELLTDHGIETLSKLYTRENVPGRLNDLFKEFLDLLWGINDMATIPRVRALRDQNFAHDPAQKTGPIFYLNGPDSSDRILDSYNFRDVAAGKPLRPPRTP